LKKVFAIITLSLMAVANIWYCYLAIKGVTHPTLMTWVMFFFAVVLSFSTYWSSKEHDLLNNVCNVGDLILVLCVIIVIAFFSNNIRLSINRTEVICLSLSAVVFIFWRITKTHELSNIFIQIIMVIAYFPTFHQLITVSGISESPIAWSVNWLSALSGVITGVLGKDKLAIIYSGRSFVMITILLILILKLT